MQGRKSWLILYQCIMKHEYTQFMKIYDAIKKKALRNTQLNDTESVGKHN